MKDDNKKIARLIKQIQRGNKSAFEEFYKLTSPKAYFIALKITQNEHDAEDILQESYIKVLEKINEIDTSKNINSWFLRIVANKSKDLLKSKSHFVFEGEEETAFEEIPEDKTEFRPEENLDREELCNEVMAAIDELTDEKRACIMMMYFGDMSVKEIAESIEVPESTVKNRLHTARKDLKNKFEKKGVTALYGAALGGVIIWALSRTSETTAAAFASSTASGTVLAGVSSSTAAASTTSVTTAAAATSTAAATGMGIAAKVAALSVAQKVVAGVAATAVIGGSTAGVATVAKNIILSDETTTYIEEVTTAPSQTEEFAFVVIPTEESTTELLSTVQITGSTAVMRDETTTKRTSSATTTKTAGTTLTTTTKKTTTVKETTTKRQTTTKPTTTKQTTTKPTTTRPTTTTEEETTTRPTTTRPTTTQPTTTQPTTTEPTTQAPATVNVEVTDMNEEVVATFSFTVEAGTEMTWEYLVTQIKSKGYEPQAGVYGDAVGAVAEAGRSYSVTAEL